jgi:hypothetical protein
MAEIYKVRRKTDGMWNTSGGGFNKSEALARVWTLKQSLSLTFTEYNLKEKFKDCEIVKFNLIEDGTLSIEDTIERKKKKEAIIKKYNRTLANFIDKLENEESNDFIYVVHFPTPYPINEYTVKKAVNVAIKMMSIKKTDYKTSHTSFAFSNYTLAFKLKLAVELNSTFINLSTLKEELFDETNSSSSN